MADTKKKSPPETTKKEQLLEECKDYEAAKKRNREILKTFEITKARLRSRATYSPVQSQLEKLKKLYKMKLEESTSGNNSVDSVNIPCSIKKTYGPTFV